MKRSTKLLFSIFAIVALLLLGTQVVYAATGAWTFGDGKIYYNDSSGKLGIGTSTPSDPLEIFTGNDSSRILLGNKNGPNSLWFGTFGGTQESNWVGYSRVMLNGFLAGNWYKRLSDGGTWMTSQTTNGYYTIQYSDPTPNNHTISNWRDVLMIKGDGRVYVNQLIVKNSAGGIWWADYVFNPNYDLMPLSDVESYVNENGHLPNIPSAEEINRDGISVGDMQAKQMAKIEELTLYTIQQQKEIDSLKEDIQYLKNKIQ